MSLWSFRWSFSCCSEGRSFLNRRHVFMVVVAIEVHMLLLNMSGQLIFAIVSLVTVLGFCTEIGLVFYMTSLMVVAVTDGSKLLWAKLTLVGSDTRVNPLMNLKISTLIELLQTRLWLSNSFVFSHVPSTNELFIYHLLLANRFDWFLFVGPFLSKLVLTRHIVEVFNCLVLGWGIMVHMWLLHTGIVDAHVTYLFEEMVGWNRLWFCFLLNFVYEIVTHYTLHILLLSFSHHVGEGVDLR